MNSPPLDALYTKWLISIDSLIFWRQVREKEGTVTQDTADALWRVQHIMLICCVGDFQEF